MPGVRWALSVGEKRVGLLGATSLVGECLLPLLTSAGWRVKAYSRRAAGQAGDGVAWQKLACSSPLFPGTPTQNPSGGLCPTANPRGADWDSHASEGEGNPLPLWICVAPIWVLPEHFALLEAHGARRVVALSSTSRFTKDHSSDPEEQAIARRLAEAEARVQSWAENRGVEWVILRPTLIYGLGRDKNIAEIARLIRRFGFFPLMGRAMGLRQPIHAEDVAAACAAALVSPAAVGRAYNLSGGETLTYREMVGRVLVALNRPPRVLTVPLGLFQLAVACLRWLPRYRHWSAAMAERMNRDLVFDHVEASRDLGFSPRPFRLAARDLPIMSA